MGIGARCAVSCAAVLCRQAVDSARLTERREKRARAHRLFYRLRRQTPPAQPTSARMFKWLSGSQGQSAEPVSGDPEVGKEFTIGKVHVTVEKQLAEGVFPRYRRVKVKHALTAAVGGFAVVYLVRDDHGLQYALKKVQAIAKQSLLLDCSSSSLHLLLLKHHSHRHHHLNQTMQFLYLLIQSTYCLDDGEGSRCSDTSPAGNRRHGAPRYSTDTSSNPYCFRQSLKTIRTSSASWHRNCAAGGSPRCTC